MEIIQQKLIWALGSLALLLIIGKIIEKYDIEKNASAAKLKWGIILLFLGGACGIFIRPLLPESMLGRASGFFLETIMGYTFGFSLIVWGAISMSMQEDSQIKGAVNRKQKYLKIAQAPITEHVNISDALHSLMPVIKESFENFGMTYHGCSKSGKLDLLYHHGIGLESLDYMRNQFEGNDVFSKVARQDRMIQMSGQKAILENSSITIGTGFANSLLSLPVKYSNEILGVFSLFFADKIAFDKNLIEALEIQCERMGQIIKRAEYDSLMIDRTRSQSLTKLIVNTLKNEPDLYSAFVKASRAVIYSLPVEEINLYLHGNGRVETYEFAFTEGGKAAVISGYLPEKEYSFLYKFDSNQTLSNDGIRIIEANYENSRLIYPILDGNFLMGNLELILSHGQKNNKEIDAVMTVLAENIFHHLRHQSDLESRKQLNQYLGLLSYFREQALRGPHLGDYFNELCESLLRIVPISSCNILIHERITGTMKSMASGHRRTNMGSAQTVISKAKTDRLLSQISDAHHRIFDLAGEKDAAIIQCLKPILSPDTRQVIVFPLALEIRMVGFLIIGDSRHVRRTSFDRSTIAVLSDVARTISLIISWRKDKNHSLKISEGIRKLVLRGKQQVRNEKEVFAPSLKSRLNGPLAGIMASCEYLRITQGMISPEASQYIGIIEKSASRIHEFTLGNNEKSKLDSVTY